MQATLKAADKPCEIAIHSNAPHGFNADYRPSYRAGEAKDGWAKLLACFKSRGLDGRGIA